MRIAKHADLAGLATFVNSAYRGESSKKGWTTEADFLGGQRTDKESLAELIADPNKVLLMFFDEVESLIGSVFLERRPDRAYLGMLTVKPDLQNGGIGRQALALSENWIVENWGLNRIEMTVIHLRTELIAWYERRGYRLTGRRSPFPTDPKFGIPRTHLEFVVMEKLIDRAAHFSTKF